MATRAKKATTKRTTKTTAGTFQDVKGWKQPTALPLGIQKAIPTGGGRYLTVGVNIWEGKVLWRIGKGFLKDEQLVPMKGSGAIPTALLPRIVEVLAELREKEAAILDHYRLNAGVSAPEAKAAKTSEIG